jgi:hypothetical protein
MRFQVLARTLAIPTIAFALLVGSASGGRTQGMGQGPTTFPDPTGDSSGALDVASVAVSGNAQTGLMSISVSVPGYQPPVSDGQVRTVAVWLDTDRNASTGDSQDGTEYGLYYADDPADPAHWWNVVQWNGSDWVTVPITPSLGFQRSSGTLTWTFSKSDLGGATAFNFYASSNLYDSAENRVANDLAPDGSLAYAYDVAGPMATTTLFTKPVIGAPVAVPSRAVAGKRITISFPVSWTDKNKPLRLASATMACDPSVAGKIIQHAESFNGTTAKLSFTIPKTAKGKRLVVRVTIKGGSLKGEDNLLVDATKGLIGVSSTLYTGSSTTKMASFLVH